MDGLVGYGSSSSDEEMETTPNVETKGPTKVASLLQRLPLPNKTKQTAGQKRKLPLSTPSASTPAASAESVIEQRDWEKKLAEEVAKEKPKEKKRIFAFGSLTQRTKPIIDDAMEEEEEETAPSAQPSTDHLDSTSALLRMLPPPRSLGTSKGVITKPKAVSSLVPHSVSQKAAASRSIDNSEPAPKVVEAVDSDSDDETGTLDFFGFTSSKIEPQAASSGSSTVPYFAPQARIYAEAPGPARPQPVESSNETELMGAVLAKKINDERAQRMIYDKELAPWGQSDAKARDAVMNIRDVSVDDQLGPNVQQTLLRNLNNRAMAQLATGSMPNAKKTPQDKMAKQKHQITHLARVAVAREEQLLDQWANSKQKKKEAAKRYGF
ncbi:hypothetical protein M3Y95_00770900 [Aphelenchoides besseyi]|nr:hypothetical protein M3Y95_00770900 [Aphelenchoides besseyi]